MYPSSVGRLALPLIALLCISVFGQTSNGSRVFTSPLPTDVRLDPAGDAVGEKVVPSGYAGKRADVDGEESDEPERGFLWTLAARDGITFRDSI